MVAAVPTDALPVLLKEMKFVGLPDPDRRCHHAETRQQRRAGAQITLARLDPGRTKQDVANLFKGPRQGPGGPPAWAHVAGGLNMISGHQAAYLMVNLTPGTYAALCTMPDTRPGPRQGAPHAAEGMLTTFTVS